MQKLKVLYAIRKDTYVLNIYNGCNFGCKYCYMPIITKKDKNDFNNNIVPRKDLFKKLQKDLELLSLENTQKTIFLSLASDPYQQLDVDLKLTRQVIEMLNNYNLNFLILTKGGKNAERDFDIYKKGDTFGTTLTFCNEEKSKQWEPDASSPNERIDALKKAHEMGIKTFVNLEPVINPYDALNLVEMTHEFVDEYCIGKINHFATLENKVNWNKFAKIIISLLNKYNKKYSIKDELKKHI